MPYVIVSDKIGEFERRSVDGPLTIGRSPECDIAVKDILLSRKHCLIEQVDGQWVASDLGSKNGTIVNGAKIEGRQALTDAVVLRLGRTRVAFFTGPISEAPAPPPKRERPADPVEALAGTVAGFEYKPPVEDEIAERPQPERAPAAMRQETPSPKPRAKAEAQQHHRQQKEHAYELLSAVPSNSWENVFREAQKTMGLTADLDEPAPPRLRPMSPIDATISANVRSGRAWRGLRVTVKRAWAKVTRLTTRRPLVAPSGSPTQV